MYHYSPFMGQFAPLAAGLSIMILIAALWTLFWKGWALWLAARRGEKVWFVVLLLVNTVGILEIIYIFVIANQKDTKTIEHKAEAPKSHEHETKE